MEELRSQYLQHGYVLIRRFFEPTIIEAVRAEAKEVFLRQLWDLRLIETVQPDDEIFHQAMFRFFEQDFAAFSNCGKVCQHLISLHRLSLDPKLIAQIQSFGLGFPTICTRPVLYFNTRKLAKSEVFYKTPPHQDWRSMQGSLNAMVVWVPLIDVDEELGALRIIPGSHSWGLLDSHQDDWYRHIPGVQDSDFISVEVHTGDALFFSAFLIHASGDNVTDRIRWSCHFRYNDLEERTYQERRFPSPYLYKPQQELITPNFPQTEQVRAVFGEYEDSR